MECPTGPDFSGRLEIGFGTLLVTILADFGTILTRFWDDFGFISRPHQGIQEKSDSGTILKRFWNDFRDSGTSKNGVSHGRVALFLSFGFLRYDRFLFVLGKILDGFWDAFG